MSLSTLINRPCTIYRRVQSGAVDELGNATDAVTSISTVCEIQQRQRDETDEGEWSQAEWVGFFPAGTTLDTSDQVEVPGLGMFEVVGAPWPTRNPRTQTEEQVEATLNRTAGAGDAS